MNFEGAKKKLSSMPESFEDYPFGPDVAVFKIKGKMFATLSIIDKVARINLKCDPLEAFELRDLFDAVIPGYHMNKKHWNTVILDGTIPQAEIERMIENSYVLVVKGLKKSLRQSLQIKYGTEC